MQRLAIKDSDWEQWVREIVTSPVASTALTDIRRRCEGSTATLESAKSLLEDWYKDFKALPARDQDDAHEREIRIQGGKPAARREPEDKTRGDVGKPRTKAARKRSSSSSDDEREQGGGGGGGGGGGEAKAGIRVMGALSASQIKQVMGWGQKKGKNGELDRLADSIFALKIAPGGGKRAKSGLSSQVTGAIAVTKLKLEGKTVIYLAQQSGKTKRDMESINALLAPRGYIAVAMDRVSGSPLHAEMTIVANMLREGIALDQLERVGVAGNKGCCRLCSGVLSKLGVAFSFTNQSAWESQTWFDPWAKAGRANPYLTE